MIWKHLGFKRDIFFVDPLRPTEEDIKLFVGRDEEIKRYLVDVLSGSRALKIVTGFIGVGKTTFVNACQYYTYMDRPPTGFKFELPHVLPCFEKVQVRDADDMNSVSQLAITRLCQNIVQYCTLNGLTPPKEVEEVLSYFLDLLVPTSQGGMSGGVSAFGFGGSLGRGAGTSTINQLRNARYHLSHLVELARTSFKFQGVYITVDNLDILSKKNLITLMNQGRDELFDIDGIYWTLIGRKGLGSIIETHAERVADYVSGTELCIAALEFPQTKEIIDVRVEAFRESDNIQCPLSHDMIEKVHFLSLQETRETLKICGEIVRRAVMQDPSLKVIPDNKAMGAFFEYAHERAKDLDLSDSKKKILHAVYGGENQSCRPKDFESYGYTSSQGFTAALNGLEKGGLLSVEARGRARIYKMTGMTVIAAITGVLGPEIQETAIEQLKKSASEATKRTPFNDAQLVMEFDEEDQ